MRTHLIAAILIALCLTVSATTFMTPKNFITVHLAADIDDDDTSMTVETGEGATLPAHPFPLVIDSEIVLVTEIATDTLTITRAQEDTVAAAHEDGANCYLNITAKYVSDLNTATNTLEGYFTSGKCNVANGGTGAATAAAACSALGVGAEDSPQFTAATLGATGSAGLLTWTNGLTEGSYETTTMDYADALLLNDITGLAVTDSNVIVGNGLTWVAESGDTLRTSLGLAIGTNVQAYDAQLADIAGLAVTDSNIIVGDGTHWVAESGATARTSLGVGTGDSPQFTGVTATGTATIDTLNVGGGSGGSGVSITNAGAITADALITASGKINSAAGTEDAPAIYMNGDSDTGFYYAASNMIGVSIGGKTQCIFRSDNNNAATQHFDVEANTGGYQSIFKKSRAGAIVQNNDLIGGIFAQGYDGAAYRNSSYIGMYVGGTPGTKDMPGTVIIGVSADGSDYMTERFRIASTGYLTVPGVYAQTSGSAANVFVDSSGNLCRSTSSECFKNNIEPVPVIDTAKVLQLEAKQFEALADTEREARNKIMNLQLAEKYYTWALESGSEGDVDRAIEQLEKAERKSREETVPVTQYGLIAQEVAAVLPKLVTYDDNGDADAVAYDRVAVLLLEQVKKQQVQIDDLLLRVKELEKKKP